MSQFNEKRFMQPHLKIKFNIIPKTRLKRFSQKYPGYKTGLARSEPGKFVMTPLYGVNAEKIHRLQPRKDDIWLQTFPKCGRLNTRIKIVFQIGGRSLYIIFHISKHSIQLTGTTWTSELLWLLMNDCDTEKAAQTPLTFRTPFIEWASYYTVVT